jgi:crotonobetainyl-CoA:carnitine CoA-transferase CaiB-like acyl-CoA transferase
MLSCYRILDLTNEKGFICGRALSDFGAEVIKIEKPGGDPSRMVGPFVNDIPDPEKSLYWFAFNANKKSITLDIEKPEGRGIFNKLVKKADVVIESFAPGYMDKIGLGYEALSKINEGIILTSISGFGQEGPYRDFKDPDIVTRALGGLVYSVGYEDRPPLTPSYHHTHTMGAMNGAAGTMTALCHRVLTGKGQHVDAISQQTLVVVCSAETEGPYALFGEIQTRHGRSRSPVKVKDGIYNNPILWECKDGDIAFNLMFTPEWAKPNSTVFNCIKEDGIDIGFMEHWEWNKGSWKDLTLQQTEEMMGILAKFFKKHTKDELLEMAVKNRFQLGPCNNAEDVLKHPQLAARGFWHDIEHPDLGTSLKYPGGAVMTTFGYCGAKRRAPRIGENNDEIYRKELGMTAEELKSLAESHVI